MAVVEADRDQWKATAARAEAANVRLRHMLSRAGAIGHELMKVLHPSAPLAASTTPPVTLFHALLPATTQDCT